MEHLKQIVGYVIAGVVLFLIVEEIKKYRARKNQKPILVAQPVQLDPGNQDFEDPGDQVGVVPGKSDRTIYFN